jgi:hypothetical protein
MKNLTKLPHLTVPGKQCLPLLRVGTGASDARYLVSNVYPCCYVWVQEPQRQAMFTPGVTCGVWVQEPQILGNQAVSLLQ